MQYIVVLNFENNFYSYCNMQVISCLCLCKNVAHFKIFF